jgi:hypothetical protein
MLHRFKTKKNLWFVNGTKFLPHFKQFKKSAKCKISHAAHSDTTEMSLQLNHKIRYLF